MMKTLVSGNLKFQFQFYLLFWFNNLSYIFSLLFPFLHAWTRHHLRRTKNDCYTVNVSVSDGRFTSYAPVTVTVTLVTREMRDNAVVIQFQNVLPDEFVIFHYQNFLRALRTEMQVQPQDVMILSIQPSYLSRQRRSSSNHNANKKRRRRWVEGRGIFTLSILIVAEIGESWVWWNWTLKTGGL